MSYIPAGQETDSEGLHENQLDPEDWKQRERKEEMLFQIVAHQLCDGCYLGESMGFNDDDVSWRYKASFSVTLNGSEVWKQAALIQKVWMKTYYSSSPTELMFKEKDFALKTHFRPMNRL